MIDVILTLSGFTAYLFVWMGRRNAGLVCMVSVWIAGAISAFILES